VVVPAGIALPTVNPADVPKAVKVTIVPFEALKVPQNLKFSSANRPKPTEKKLLPLNILSCPVDSCNQKIPVGRLDISGDASCMKPVDKLASLSIVMESLARKLVPNVPVVILVVAKLGISEAARVELPVIIPFALTVTFI